MFIAILTYKKPQNEVDKYLQAHRDYLAEHYAIGDLIASGPQNPRIGGVIMIKAVDREAVKRAAEKCGFQLANRPYYYDGVKSCAYRLRL